MMNALFVVCRESLEAFLLIGLLQAFLRRQDNSKKALKYMWGGVAIGVLASLAVGYGLITAQGELTGVSLELFQAALLFSAAIFMTQMCIWMKRHAPTLKRDLEARLDSALSVFGMMGIAFVAATAIVREGAETVIFLFGMGIEATEKGAGSSLVVYSVAGFALAGVVAWSFNRGLRLISPKNFFKVTSFFLLLTSSSLVVAGTKKLLSTEVIPPIISQVWDTSFLLDENTSFGGFFSILTGYHAMPALMTVIVYISFWVMYFLLSYVSQTSRKLAPVHKTAS